MERPDRPGLVEVFRRAYCEQAVTNTFDSCQGVNAGSPVRFRMLRLLLILLCSLELSACSGGDAAPPAQAASTQVQIGFPKGGLADTITVTAVDRLPLRAAELVAPDGSTVKSNWINVASAPSVGTGQWLANLSETPLSGTSVAPVLTSPDALANAALYGQAQLLAMVSQADIALPDPVAYRRDWVNYRVRLSFGTAPGEIETREVPAPEPPPLPPS